MGYGNVAPEQPLSKIFVILYALLSITLISTLLAFLVDATLNAQDDVMSLALKDADKPALSVSPARPSTEPAAESHVDRWHGVHDGLELFTTDVQILLKCALTIFTTLLFGTCLFMTTQSLTSLDALYASVTSVATIGFGEFEPAEGKGKAIIMCWLCFSTFVVANVVARSVAVLARARGRRECRRVLRAGVDVRTLRSLDWDGSGEVEKVEFLAGVLVGLGRVEREEVQGVLRRFDQLDVDGSGAIGVSEVDV